MCLPLALTAGQTLALSLATSAASTAAELTAQGQQARAQTGYQQQLVKANNAGASLQLSQLRIQQAQSRESAAREGEKARLASAKARSTAAVAAGEAGVSGHSVDALLQEYSATLGQFKENANRQRKIDDAAYADRAEAISAETRYGNLNLNAPVMGPNYAAAMLRFSGSALGAYRQYKRDGVGGP